MAETIELIKKHNQEIEEYMNNNGEWSFHRFSDGSIRYKAPIFDYLTRIKNMCSAPVTPVKWLEQLKKATGTGDTLVTINDFVELDAGDIILGETEIEVLGAEVTIKYSGIHSLIIDYDHDLKAVIRKIKDGNFGEVVWIEDNRVKTCDIKVFTNGISVPAPGVYMEKYMTYEHINAIKDDDDKFIYWRQ